MYYTKRMGICQRSAYHPFDSSDTILMNNSMHAYFTASIIGKKHYLENYLAIIQILKSQGVTVTSDHIINTDESTIHFETKKERLNFHKNLEHWINKADFMVVEATFPSISVGYEIALALHVRKPILVLYSQGNPPSLINNNEEERLVCEKYAPSTLKETINDFIKYVQGSTDTRFTFFITSEIARYLLKVAKKQRLPKSVYLRNLILQDMEKTT